MKNKDVDQLYREYVLPTYRQLPICLVKGKGSYVWDIEGKRFLDFFPGWAVSGLGHCHPIVVQAIKEQARKMLHVPNNFQSMQQAKLAQAITRLAFPARVFFCNSGAEAMEAAIKFSRKFGAPSGRFEIVTMLQSFHGRTLAALAATGQTKYQAGFEPLPVGFRYAEINDFDGLKRMVNEKTVAIVLELVQGEGGIRVAEKSYVQKLREFCDQRNLLLIFDEVQTGMGRTGKWFAFQHYGVEPDLMILAKSLGGGVPIGALLVHRRVKEEVFVPGTHASTYGGNPLVASAALGVIKAIERERLIRNTEAMGKYLRSKLDGLKTKFPKIIAEVRGIGLMLGMELTKPGASIVDQCREEGLLINCTQDKVLRIMPAMTVSQRMIDQAVRILERAFEGAG